MRKYLLFHFLAKIEVTSKLAIVFFFSSFLLMKFNNVFLLSKLKQGGLIQQSILLVRLDLPNL